MKLSTGSFHGNVRKKQIKDLPMKVVETSSTDLRPQAGSTNYIGAVVEADLEVEVLSKIFLANEVSRGFRSTGLVLV